MKKAVLVLEDGSSYWGKVLGKGEEAHGEVVFNTSMTGYQEILTDPTYKGKIVAMTYPLAGNYGFNEEDSESDSSQVNGLIVKELCDMPSNWRSSITPESFLNYHGINGIYDIDTRHLTRHIRDFGSMYGIISSTWDNIEGLVQRAKELSGLHWDFVSLVTSKKLCHFQGYGPRIVVVDLGVKKSILHSLISLGVDLYVVPAYTDSAQILSINPDGILFSNGPGDPTELPTIIQTLKHLIGKKPIMGIGLGHQLLGLALGLKTYRLKVGHHGKNHPVKEIFKNKVHITCQNHSYSLGDDIPESTIVTHINLNDNTIEGFTHKDYPLMGIQYHPEAGALTEDTNNVYKDFISLIYA